MSKSDNKAEDYIDYHEIIECITGALDAKDRYTANHSWRVSELAKKICEIIGLSNSDTNEIHIAAHLHDIGKIGVPDSILNKEGPLTTDEWDIIKKHSRIGYDILNKSSRMKQISGIVLHHHERYDGKGYPDGIKGNDIPLGSRIIAVCDSIDAMTTQRSYRSILTPEECYIEIEKNLGFMYDPFIGKYILEHWEDVIKPLIGIEMPI